MKKDYTPKDISKITGVDTKAIRNRLRNTKPRFLTEKYSRWLLTEEEYVEEVEFWINRK